MLLSSTNNSVVEQHQQSNGSGGDDLESNDGLKQIFNNYDQFNSGLLSVDTFQMLIKENWPQTLDDSKLENLITNLDPFKSGQIDYGQFVNGIKQIMTEANGGGVKDESQNENQFSDNNKINNLYVNVDMDRTSNSSNISSSSDTFNEYDTLTDSESTHNSKNPFIDITSDLLSSKRRASELYRSNNQNHNHSSNSPSKIHELHNKENQFHTSTSEDQIIQQLENKVRDLENQIDVLKLDHLAYLDKYSKLQVENSNLNEKIHELEESTHDIERNFQTTIEAEKIHFNEYFSKLNSKFSEEKDVLLAQINKNEIDYNFLKNECSKYQRQMNELNRVIDANSLNECQLDEKYNNLKNDYQHLLKEKDLFKEENETLKLKHNQRIDILTKELSELRTQQLQSKRRTTLINEDASKVKDLETELQLSKQECKQLQTVIQDLDAQLLRNSVDAGKFLLSQTNVPSLAAEIETLSKDELMDKLKQEQTTNIRYREYVERILAVVMEKNPEILEIRQMPLNSSNAKILNNKSAVTFSKY